MRTATHFVLLVLAAGVASVASEAVAEAERPARDDLRTTDKDSQASPESIFDPETGTFVERPSSPAEETETDDSEAAASDSSSSSSRARQLFPGVVGLSQQLRRQRQQPVDRQAGVVALRQRRLKEGGARRQTGDALSKRTSAVSEDAPSVKIRTKKVDADAHRNAPGPQFDSDTQESVGTHGKYVHFEDPSEVILKSRSNEYLKDHYSKHGGSTQKKKQQPYDYVIGGEEEEAENLGNEVPDRSVTKRPFTYDFTIGEERNGNEGASTKAATSTTETVLLVTRPTPSPSRRAPRFSTTTTAPTTTTTTSRPSPLRRKAPARRATESPAKLETQPDAAKSLAREARKKASERLGIAKVSDGERNEVARGYPVNRNSKFPHFPPVEESDDAGARKAALTAAAVPVNRPKSVPKELEDEARTFERLEATSATPKTTARPKIAKPTPQTATGEWSERVADSQAIPRQHQQQHVTATTRPTALESIAEEGWSDADAIEAALGLSSPTLARPVQVSLPAAVPSVRPKQLQPQQSKQHQLLQQPQKLLQQPHQFQQQQPHQFQHQPQQFQHQSQQSQKQPQQLQQQPQQLLQQPHQLLQEPREGPLLDEFPALRNNPLLPPLMPGYGAPDLYGQTIPRKKAKNVKKEVAAEQISYEDYFGYGPAPAAKLKPYKPALSFPASATPATITVRPYGHPAMPEPRGEISGGASRWQDEASLYPVGGRRSEGGERAPAISWRQAAAAKTKTAAKATDGHRKRPAAAQEASFGAQQQQQPMQQRKHKFNNFFNEEFPFAQQHQQQLRGQQQPRSAAVFSPPPFPSFASSFSDGASFSLPRPFAFPAAAASRRA